MASKRTMTKITPAMAEQLLNNNPNNRAMRQGRAEAYASDMVNGQWTECLAPIAIYDDGEVADGQHRLWAIIESGTTQEFELVTGLDRAAGLNIDTGITRSLVDNARISGTDSELSNQLVGVTRGIEDGAPSNGHHPRSAAEQLDVVTRHRKAADWALHNSPVGRGMRNAPIVCAISRAWYVEKDKERLAKFSHIVSKGFADGVGDSAAIAFRNYAILKGQQGISLVSTANWRDTFLKAQNAIWYFMLSRSLTAIKSVVDETYPLAGAKSRFAPKTQRGKTALNKVNKAK